MQSVSRVVEERAANVGRSSVLFVGIITRGLNLHIQSQTFLVHLELHRTLRHHRPSYNLPWCLESEYRRNWLPPSSPSPSFTKSILNESENQQKMQTPEKQNHNPDMESESLGTKAWSSVVGAYISESFWNWAKMWSNNVIDTNDTTEIRHSKCMITYGLESKEKRRFE
jgi:hypothetical protein